MSRYFLGPIKNPTWKDFFIRVGGAVIAILVTILVSKAFFPEYQTTAAVATALGIAALAGVQELRHNLDKKAKHRA
jgi:CDP-diglyceride synthetase